MPEKEQKFKQRGYSAIHAFSWAINLEKFGYTSCMFRNCQYMALDIDAIATHHYECPGGISKESLFMCAICNLGTTEECTLNNHYFLTHPEVAQIRGISTMDFKVKIPKIISNVRKKSWELFLERKGYIKCLIQNCQFISDKINIMEEHYERCSEREQLFDFKYICPSCNGKTDDEEYFKKHSCECISNSSIQPPSTSDSSTPPPEVTPEIIASWTNNIRKHKVAKCPNKNCKYLDNSVDVLKKHFLKCKQTLLSTMMVCEICEGWLQNVNKIEEHMRSVHKPVLREPSPVAEDNDRDNCMNQKGTEGVLSYSSILNGIQAKTSTAEESEEGQDTTFNGQQLKSGTGGTSSTLEKLASLIMKEHKELPVQVNISVEDKTWSVGVAPTVVGGPKFNGNIIDDFNEIGHYMRNEAKNLLNCVRTKNTVRNKIISPRYLTRYQSELSDPKKKSSTRNKKCDILFNQYLKTAVGLKSKSAPPSDNIGESFYNSISATNLNENQCGSCESSDDDFCESDNNCEEEFQNEPSLNLKNKRGHITKTVHHNSESSNDDELIAAEVDERSVDRTNNLLNPVDSLRNENVLNVDGVPIVFDTEELEIIPIYQENGGNRAQQALSIDCIVDSRVDKIESNFLQNLDNSTTSDKPKDNICDAIITLNKDCEKILQPSPISVNKQKDSVEKINGIVEVHLQNKSTSNIGELIGSNCLGKENMSHSNTDQKKIDQTVMDENASSGNHSDCSDTVEDLPVCRSDDCVPVIGENGNSAKNNKTCSENKLTSHNKINSVHKRTKKKKSDLKKCKVKEKEEGFLGFPDNSSSCSKLNHLLSYCNILGISAELHTYPLHVKFDVTPTKNQPAGSSNTLNDDDKGNKKPLGRGENNKREQCSEDRTDKNRGSKNSEISSRKRKLEIKKTKSSARIQQRAMRKGAEKNHLGRPSSPNAENKVTNVSEEHPEMPATNLSLQNTSSDGQSCHTESSSNTCFNNPSNKQEEESSNVQKESSIINDSKQFETGAQNIRNNENSIGQIKNADNDSSNSSDESSPVRKKGRRGSKEDDVENNKLKKRSVSQKDNDQNIHSSIKLEGLTKNVKSDDPEALIQPKSSPIYHLNDRVYPSKDNDKVHETDKDEDKSNADNSFNFSEINTPQNSSTPILKRKRGRPRKKEVPSTPLFEDGMKLFNSEERCNNQSLGSESFSVECLNDSLSSNMAQQCREQSEVGDKFEESIQSVNSTSPPTVLVKRKPGRPRKNPLPPEVRDTSGNFIADGSPNKMIVYSDLIKSELKRADNRSGVNCDGFSRGSGYRRRGRRPSNFGIGLLSESSEPRENLGVTGTCAICQREVIVRDYEKKHMPVHNFLCWLEGEDPLDVNNENAMINWLTRCKKKFPKHLFKCEKCGESKKSVKGFLSHLQFCGKTLEERQKLMVTCLTCGRVMMPSSLEQHRPLCGKKVPGSGMPKEVVDVNLSPRKAAKQCLDKMADIVPTLLSDDGVVKKRAKANSEDDSDVKFTHSEEESESEDLYSDVPDEIKKMYTVKAKRSTKHLRTIWELAVAEGKQLNCPCPSCDFTSATFNEMNDHYRTCQYDFQGYVCRDCKHSTITEKEMVRHIRKLHSLTIKNKDKVVERAVPKRDPSSMIGPSHIPFLKKAEIEFYQSVKHSKFFRPAVMWTKQQREINYSTEPVFDEYKFSPEFWQELNSETAEQYLPEKKMSIRYCLKENSPNWKQLKLFESHFLNEDLCVLYSGGPVWGLAWAPSTSDTQYLAVSTHLSMSSNYKMGSIHTGPGVIQIWSLQNLNINSNKSNGLVKVEYVICHDYGGSWALEWCPSGCYDETRIGLLAAATTSGIILVFAVPHPELLTSNIIVEGTKYYKTEPSLYLKLCPFIDSQCTRISWSKVKPHRSLAAGFTNGVIAVWDLNAKSILLKSDTILYPFKTFNAHHSNITGLCMSSASETYIVSSALDKTVKFWDINDTTAPHSVHRRGLVNDVAWLQHWLCAVAVYDESYMPSNTTVALHSVRDYIYQPFPFVCNIKSSAWSVSVSDWLNAIATSYDNGQITLAFAKQLDPNSEKREDKRKIIKTVIETSLFDIVRNTDISAIGRESVGQPTSINEQTKVEQSKTATSSTNLDEQSVITSSEQSEVRIINCCTFEEVAEKYGVQFDCDLNFKAEPLKGNQMNPVDIYPLMSANKVEWNPNIKALLSLAVGYQSGFVVIPKLTMPDEDQTYLNQTVLEATETQKTESCKQGDIC